MPMNWRDRRLLALFGIDHRIVQAPMAGVTSPAMAVAVSQAGGLGAIAGAMLTPQTLRGELQIAKQGTSPPINADFFVHRGPAVGAARGGARLPPLAPHHPRP